MPATERLQRAAIEITGTLAVCTPDDRSALIDLYRAVHSHASLAEIAEYTRDQELCSWILYRDREGEISIALFLQAGVW